MRTLALACIVLAAVAGAALAQDGAQAEAPAYHPEFEPYLAAVSYGRLIPRMLDRGVSGVAHLCCTPRADRSLDCETALEWPERRGDFGRSARRLARDLELTPASYAAYQSVPGRVVHLSVEFRILPVSSEDAAALEEIEARAQNLCGADSRPDKHYVVAARRAGGRVR